VDVSAAAAYGGTGGPGREARKHPTALRFEKRSERRERGRPGHGLSPRAFQIDLFSRGNEAKRAVSPCHFNAPGTRTGPPRVDRGQRVSATAVILSVIRQSRGNQIERAAAPGDLAARVTEDRPARSTVAHLGACHTPLGPMR